MAESTDHDDVGHAGHDLCRIFNRFSPAQLAVACVEVNGCTAELMHTCFKREACPGGTFLENHDKRTVEKRVVWLVILELALDNVRAFDQVLVFSQS